MTNVMLTVKGDIERINLGPGDKLVVNVHDQINENQAEQIKDSLHRYFSDNDIIVSVNMDFTKVVSQE